jgi:hypothetical protein
VGAVGNARPNVVNLETWELSDDIFGRPALGEIAQDERHPDSVALDAWFSEADLGIDNDP